MNRLFALVLAFAACPPPTPVPDGGSLTPVVTSITPSSGSIAGGTTVAVNGANFAAGATVTFGGVNTTLTFESDRRVTAVTPAAPASTVGVTLTNPGGRTSTLAGAFTYLATSTTPITEAILQNPADSTDASGAAMVSVNVVAHVQVPTITNGTGQGVGVRAQVGFATSPAATPIASDFSWTDAMYGGDVDGPAAGDKLRDSYSGAVSLPAPTGAQVIYFVAARFSVDNGATWTIADRDGSANGVLTTQLAKVTVTLASVQWCKLGGAVVEAPPIVLLSGAGPGPTIYGQVFKTAVTPPVGAGAGIKGALGYGTGGTDPSTWTWVSATFNTDKGMNDEYQATLPNPGAAGSYRFAFRFNHNDGQWSYCDADGLATNGFTEAQTGTLTVVSQTCRLGTVSSSALLSGSPLAVAARTLIAGVSGNPGASPNLRMQIGVGPQGSNASASPLWGWKDAAFSADVAGEDEFTATVYPAYTGNRSVSARASLDGITWAYCDLNGSDVNGYEVAQQYDVVVGNHVEFDFCNLQAPATADGGTMIYGQVFEPGLTPNAASPFIAQLGVGAEPEDPGLAWTWRPAAFNVISGNNNEYRAALPTDAGPGLHYAFRFSLDAGVWCYGDLNVSTNGFSGGSNTGLVAP